MFFLGNNEQRIAHLIEGVTLVLLSCLRNWACSGGKDSLTFVEVWRAKGEVSPKLKLKRGGQVLETRNLGLRTSGVSVRSVCLASACLPIVKTLYKERLCVLASRVAKRRMRRQQGAG